MNGVQRKVVGLRKLQLPVNFMAHCLGRHYPLKELKLITYHASCLDGKARKLNMLHHISQYGIVDRGVAVFDPMPVAPAVGAGGVHKEGEEGGIGEKAEKGSIGARQGVGWGRGRAQG